MWKVKVLRSGKDYIEYVGGADLRQAIDHVLSTGVYLHEIISIEIHFPERG